MKRYTEHKVAKRIKTLERHIGKKKRGRLVNEGDKLAIKRLNELKNDK